MDWEAVIIPISILLTCFLGASLVYLPIEAFKRSERREVRKLYMELLREKLDIIKTALSLGYSDQDVAKLDQRLERLIGSEKTLEKLKTGKQVKPQDQLLTKDLVEEIDLLKAGREEQKK